MANYITPAQLKAYPLPVTSAQWAKIGDDQIDIVSDYAAQHLEDYMDRKILITEYTDRMRRGTGSSRMMLSLYPVTELLAVSAYDTRNNPTAYDLNEFYVDPDTGILEFVNRDRYAFGRTNIWTVRYRAGYSTVPGPILHAIALQTVKMLQPMFRGGSQFVETEFISDIDEQIVELLDYYKRRRIG